VLGPWNAAALPEIMAGALQENKRGGKQALCAGWRTDQAESAQQTICVV